MKQVQIDRFFEELDRQLGLAADIIIVGASAASLMGFVRPSFDIDFEIRVKSNPGAHKTRIADAIARVSRLSGIATNYGENISGWSQINYLDYRKTAAPYKKIGKLNVKIIAPEYWTIGKMARFLELDIQDMESVIKGKKIAAEALLEVWARAVRSSDLSLELGQFQEHVLWFLKKSAKRVWGRETDPEILIQSFLDQLR